MFEIVLPIVIGKKKRFCMEINSASIIGGESAEEN
jgi:hypothetical protein